VATACAIFRPMSSITELEKEILSLPYEARKRLAMAAWSSLERDQQGKVLSDAQGLATALERDKDIESGKAQPISYSQFRRLTDGRRTHED